MTELWHSRHTNKLDIFNPAGKQGKIDRQKTARGLKRSLHNNVEWGVAGTSRGPALHLQTATPAKLYYSSLQIIFNNKLSVLVILTKRYRNFEV